MESLALTQTEAHALAEVESLALYPTAENDPSLSATLEVSSFEFTHRPHPSWDSAEVAEVLSQLRHVLLAPASLPSPEDVDFAV